MRDGVGTGENDGIWEVVSIELGVGLGVNMLIDSESSDVDIGLRRSSELTVAVGDTGIDVLVELGANEDVKIGIKIELVSGGKELSVNTLMDRDNSEVGRGIRTFVVVTGVVGTTVVKISPISEVTVKSIAGDVVKGRDLRISEEPMENKNVSVGTTSIELSSDGETIIDDVSTSIVDAMLKDGLDVEGVGVITIITTVVSSIGIRSTTLLLILRDERSGSTAPGLPLLLALTGRLCCMGLLLTRIKGRSAMPLLIVRNGICVCGSAASTDVKVRGDDDDADMTLAGIGKLLSCGDARLVLSGTELLGSDIGIRIASSAPMEVGAMKEMLSIEGGKSAPEPIPDPMVSVGIGRLLVVIAIIPPLVSSVEVKAIAVEVCIDLLG